MIKADILACYPTTWFSRLIQWFTQSSITHVAIAIDDKYVMETSAFGVKMSKLEIMGKYKLLRCTSLTEAQRDDIVAYAKSIVDVPYDYRLLLNIALERLFNINLNWNHLNKLICVETVVEAFKRQGIDLLPDIEPDDIVPKDIVTSKWLVEVDQI